MSGCEAKAPPLRFRMSPSENADGRLSSTNEGWARTPAAPWMRKRLGDEVFFSKGKGYSKGDISASGTPLFLYGRLYTDYQAEVESVDTFAQLQKGSVLSKGGEVVVPGSGETPEDIARASAIMARGIILGGDLNILTPRDFEVIYSPFLALSLSNGQTSLRIADRAQGKTVVHLHNSDLEDLQVALPSLSEQRRVGIFFRSLDALIVGREKALAKLEILKKSMLLKMFPQGDATVPEVRFKGFEDEWKKKRLGDMGTPYNGLSGKTKDDFGHGNGKYVTYMNVFSNAIADFVQCDRVEVDKKQNEVRNGDVFFTTSSETPEEVGMSSVWIGEASNIYLNSFCFGYRPKPGNASEFLAYMFRSDSFRCAITYLAQGISRYNISKTKVMDLDILLPEIEEQQKIGAYFRSLDTLIAARRKEVEKLKQMKKALLKRMFV